jgi:AcrR family transcriptional regulator
MLVTNIVAATITWMSRSEHTRRALQDAAVRLFAMRGFDEVTVEEIAEAAGVSHMTFFRHFPTKVSVLLDDPYDPVIGAMVAATDPSLTPLERIRRGVLDALEHMDEPDDDMTRTRLGILVGRDDLVAHAWANNRATERIIVDALRSTGVPTLDAHVAAGAAMGAMMAALIDWAEDGNAGSLGDRIHLALDLLCVSDRSVAGHG